MTAAAKKLKRIEPEKRGPGRPRGEARPKNFSGYFDPQLVQDLKSIAKEEHRTLNGQVEYILQEFLKKREGGGNG